MNGSLPACAIVNPRSANGRTADQWPRLSQRLSDRFSGLVVRTTEGPRDATSLAREAIAAGHPTIISCGGDGTHNEVLNGFFDQPAELAAPGTTLGFLPCGAENNLCRGLGMPMDPLDAVRFLSDAVPAEHTVGRVSFIGTDDYPATLFFLNAVRIGDVAFAVVADDGGSRWSTRRLAGAFKSALDPEQSISLVIDDQPPRTMTLKQLAVLNGRYCDQVRLAPEATFADGQLHVVFREAGTLLQAINAPLSWSSMRGQHVALESAEAVTVTVDGEVVGRLPATVELARQQPLRVLSR